MKRTEPNHQQEIYRIREEKRVVNAYCSVTMQHEGMLLYHKHRMYYAEVPLLNGNLSDMENIFKFLVIPSLLKYPLIRI
jgi:hypothetical protein